MTRNCKVLGLTVVAALAMTAVMASAASAAEFTSDQVPVSLHGGQATEHKFTTNTGTVLCAGVTFTAAQASSPSPTVSIAPSYSGCEIPGLFELDVVINGCDYVFEATTTTSGTVDIATCGTNKYIQVSSLFFCRIRVPEQENVAGITYADEGLSILVTINVNSLKYEESGLFCAGSGGTNGTYTGSTLASGNGGEADLGIE